MAQDLIDSKNMTFVTTPLQNLRNILQEVDSTAEYPNKKDFSDNSIQNHKNVSKNDLQKIISELKVLPEQYITKSSIGRIFNKICKNLALDDNIDIFEKLKKITMGNSNGQKC